MADNIFKVFRPDKKDPQCLKRGMWYNDTPADRLEHVKEILKLYKERFFDWNDLVWHLKYAVTGDIYVSEAVFDLIQSGKCWPEYIAQKTNPNSVKKDYFEWLDKIIIDHTTQKPNGTLDESLLEIHEKMGKKISGQELRLEHVIPAKFYLKRLIELYDKGLLTQPTFDNFRKLINVCIITKDEDAKLNSVKGLKDSMPKEFDWDDPNPFMRYDRAGIKIHNRS